MTMKDAPVWPVRTADEGELGRRRERTPGEQAEGKPKPGAAGPRTPYPVDDPAIADPERQPGSAPDVVPGRTPPGTQM
jgi:hypothetical protein